MDDPLNLSFPGLNQEHQVNAVEKRAELMTFFKDMAEADAARELEEEQRILTAKMKQD